jgi:FkbM family methyltransferase
MYNIEGFQMELDDKDSLGLSKGINDPSQVAAIRKFAKGTCIDIGANIGFTTLLMGEKASEVYAFEPEKSNFQLLKSNVEANIDKLGKISLFNFAVGNENKKVDLYLCDFNRGMHRTYPSKWCKDKVQVQMIRLDDLIDNKIDFIKMDIEGAEFPALKGMIQILETSHPTLMIEFHPPSIAESGINPEKIHRFLTHVGYNKFSMVDDLANPLSYYQIEQYTLYEAAKNLICT